MAIPGSGGLRKAEEQRQTGVLSRGRDGLGLRVRAAAQAGGRPGPRDDNPADPSAQHPRLPFSLPARGASNRLVSPLPSPPLSLRPALPSSHQLYPTATPPSASSGSLLPVSTGSRRPPRPGSPPSTFAPSPGRAKNNGPPAASSIVVLVRSLTSPSSTSPGRSSPGPPTREPLPTSLSSLARSARATRQRRPHVLGHRPPPARAAPPPVVQLAPPPPAVAPALAARARPTLAPALVDVCRPARQPPPPPAATAAAAAARGAGRAPPAQEGRRP